MSRPRFRADQDFNEHILQGVRRAEPTVEMCRLRDVGLEKSADTEVLAYAAAQDWIVVSHDVTTMSAAAYSRVAAGQAMLGLLLVHQSSPLAPVIDSLVLIWAASTADEWRNQVRFLPL